MHNKFVQKFKMEIYIRHFNEASYSNQGYALLGLIIEEVSGLPFDEYVTKQIKVFIIRSSYRRFDIGFPFDKIFSAAFYLGLYPAVKTGSALGVKIPQQCVCAVE